MAIKKLIPFLTYCALAFSATAQLSHTVRFDPSGSSYNEAATTPPSELLVNTRLFEFDSSLLTPWIDEITHLRVFGVDFHEGKDSQGNYQYVSDERMNDFISFTKEKNLKVVWTLNVSSFTLDQEMAYVKEIISKGLNIVAFEYGGEFYLKKYVFGDMKAKGVVETIRMDGENRDYLNLLDLWLPAVTEVYPFGEYEHILITASVTGENNKTTKYRREFNQKVFTYVKNKPEIKGKVSFSYHIYAGAKPSTYSKDEEAIITPEKVDWSFLDKKPPGSRWVVTESGYYVTDFSKSQLDQAREFYIKQAKQLNKRGLMGIHTLVTSSTRQNALALYNLNGITPVGEMVQNWLSNGDDSGSGVNDENEEIDEAEDPEPVNNTTSTSSSTQKNAELVKIYPEYTGFFQWIHFNQTLVFSNGKSYKRSYWFSSPDFTKDDIGKPISYFKKVLKSK
ncbi:MAG: hypothetical protein WBG42_00455 [Cryomorphaceae bacterium]